MSIFKINITPIPHSLDTKFKWCIDSPSMGQDFEVNSLSNEGLQITGWLLKGKYEKGTMVVIQNEDIQILKLNKERLDVIEKVCNRGSIWSYSECCGFEHTVPLTSDKLVLGIVHDNTFSPLYKLELMGSFKVLEGERGWLYLNNDTNDSVEQFKGKIKLSLATRSEWKKYMTEFCDFSAAHNLPSVFLVAPSKEFVVDEFYPFKGSKNTPLDQVEKLKTKSFPLLTLVDTLKKAPYRTFRVCDTHWSVFGAMIASLELIRKLGMKVSPAQELFANDDYIIRQTGGDLGSKLFPPRTHEESMLTNYNYKNQLGYDNNLPNFGRTLIVENEQAIHDKNLLFFGSSSAYSMLNYLSRIFRCVMFVHSAGSIDKTLVTSLRPDYLVAQSNARFLVKAPSFNIDLRDLIKSKKGKLLSTPEVLINPAKSDFAHKAKALVEM